MILQEKKRKPSLWLNFVQSVLYVVIASVVWWNATDWRSLKTRLETVSEWKSYPANETSVFCIFSYSPSRHSCDEEVSSLGRVDLGMQVCTIYRAKWTCRHIVLFLGCTLNLSVIVRKPLKPQCNYTFHRKKMQLHVSCVYSHTEKSNHADDDRS